MASSRSRIITLLTDFGLGDSYVAEMKGVLLSLAPGATLVDVTHLVPPQETVQGALILASAFSRFPSGTVHLAVVDPGVGTERRAVAAEAGGYLFVGPDNGLLSLALERAGKARVIHLTESRFWLPEVSATFHGRDIFAPVAAHLARGVPLEEMGTPISSLTALPFPKPSPLDDGGVRGQVVAVDHFGNLVTNIREEDLFPSSGRDGPQEIEVGDRRLQGVHRTYGDVGEREPLALIGSSGYLVLAVMGGSAAEELGIGTLVEFVVRKPKG